MEDSAPTYPRLLEQARELGRLDGRFAAAFESRGAGSSTDRCLGRTPEEFARLLWEGRPGTPPAGLEVNAPLWYATGFSEGLERGSSPERRTARALLFREVFTLPR
jgi:hypothetical protein